MRATSDPLLALQSAISNPPKLALIDVKMPVMNGIRAVELIKEEYFLDTPRIFSDFRKQVKDVPENPEKAAEKFLEMYSQHPTPKYPAMDLLIEKLIKEVEIAYDFYTNKRSPLRD